MTSASPFQSATQSAAESAVESASTRASQTESVSRTLGQCRHCGAANPVDALFCGECGHALAARQCPHCGRALTPTADFCEGCGQSLLTHQCRFCYAAMAEDAAFCPECGNPKAGLVCARCGTRNFYDFCTACAAPLTEGAQQALAELARDPHARQALDRFAELAALEAELPAPAGEPVVKAPPAPPRRGLLSQRGKQAFGTLQAELEQMRSQALDEAAALIARQRAEADRLAAEASLRQADDQRRDSQAASQKRIEVQLKRAQALVELKALIQQLASRSFGDHQEARRLFMALRHQFPGLLQGWQCNCCSVVHPTPNDCADPNQGGQWIVAETVSDAD